VHASEQINEHHVGTARVEMSDERLATPVIDDHKGRRFVTHIAHRSVETPSKV